MHEVIRPHKDLTAQAQDPQRVNLSRATVSEQEIRMRMEQTCQWSAVIFPPPNINRHLVNVQLGEAANTRGHFQRSEARQFPQKTAYT